MEQIDEIAERLFRGRDTEMVTSLTSRKEQDWYPDPVEITEDDIRAYFAAQGWPTWDSLTADHLNRKERDILDKAIKAARAYADAIRDGAEGLALILVAGPVEGDSTRTGYGCGKTTLAKIINYATSYYYPPTRREDLRIHQSGVFMESRQLMARFDDDNVTPVPGGNPLVIDDVGREGTLRWEKRDPELQLQEKQDRYYTVVDKCYQKNRNLVITSNMSAKELAAFLGGATWSRLLQMCPPQFRINMTGIRDMRPLLGEQQGENFGF